MKALFSNPPWWVQKEGKFLRKHWRAGVRAGSRWPSTAQVKSKPGNFVFGDYLPYPFFMGYAASYTKHVTKEDIRFRDSIALRESYKHYYQHIRKEAYDYIFIEIATPSQEHDLAVIQKIHKLSPKTKVVITGPITTTQSELLLTEFPVHACIRGEYEKGSVRVLSGNDGIVDYDFLTIKEMNDAPFPYYDNLIARRYFDYNPIGQIFPHAQIWTSRGCPFKCIFCVWPATMTGSDPDGTKTRTVRHYSADYVEALLKDLIGRFGYKSIYFDDDTFNLGNKHVVDICGVMRKLGIPWSAMCRADTIKFETWALMKESGCFGVKIGFESGNQYVVNQIVNKHLNLEEARLVVHEVKRLGMTVHGTFTYGLPGETKEHMLDTKRFIASLPFDSVQESGTAEIEGTPLHTLRQTGHLTTYAGANVDSSYHREVDGNTKWQQLVNELKQK